MKTDTRFQVSTFKSWQRNESLGSLGALSEENDRKARENWISASSALNKSQTAREFCCLKLLKTPAALTLLTEFSLVRLPRSLSAALLALCPRFSQQIFTFSLSLAEFKDDTRFQVLDLDFWQRK
ncbi:Hypothetical_protein [Hexamita inflata]|uniref:Hypothetical_protein n=1 Tax=Hexamita inflata TaxID=28002 RepID=A0AA86P293_9EUKA|nr:Hypothetical protein HINF_LOCUS14061 [Hexamita inflata]CAI9930290.1 Hypothetical protein HINF_LOCUS17935 [Hexamita inflata]CAI9930301.1 Hypothetical protein HINF_LOCUS17946 [Hexamita inflata]